MKFSSVRESSDRVSNGISRATLQVADDTQLLQELSFGEFSSEAMQTIEHAHPYGFSAHPKKPSMIGGIMRYAVAFMTHLGGARSHGVAFAVSDRRYRLYKMQEGEVALHDDQGQWIYLTRNGVLFKTPNGNSLTLQVDQAQQQQSQSQGQTGGGMGQDATQVPQPACKIVADKSRIHFYNGTNERGYYDIAADMWVMLVSNNNRAVVHETGVKIKYGIGAGGNAIFVDAEGCHSTVAMDVKADPIPDGSP